MRGADGHSDHTLVRAKIKIRAPVQNNTNERKESYIVHWLEEDETVKKFQHHLREKAEIK